MTKLGLLAAFCAVGGVLTASGQNIRSHYVSKAESDGVIYHTFPVTLFESREAGDLTFDITYKEHRGGRATINFTCRMAQAVPADSVRFVSGRVVLWRSSTSNRRRRGGNTATLSTPTVRCSADSSTRGPSPK